MCYYPLTAPQQNIWNLQKYYEHTAIGNIAGMITFADDCACDMPMLLAQAVNHLIETSDSLRTRFVNDAGTIKQYFSDYVREQISVRDYSASTQDEIVHILQQEAEMPLPLLNQPLYRFSIIQHENQYSVFMVIHHLICDGWTSNLIANKITDYVANAGETATVDSAKFSYTRFIEEGTNYCQSRRFEGDTAYWDVFAQGYSEPSYIKPQMPGSDSVKAARYTYGISQTETDRIYTYCAGNEISPDTLYKTAFAIYLYNLNHVPSVVLGTPVLNRDGAVAKNTIGMYVSTMPVVLQISETASVRSHMEQCVSNARETFRHCKYPYSDILAKAKYYHNEVTQLFDVMISYENSSISNDVIVAMQWFFQGYSENALTVHIDDRNGDHCLDISYDYQLHLFRTEKEVELLAKRIQFIIQQMIDDDAQKVSDIQIIPAEEYNRIVYEFNDTASPYPRDKCMHELFAEQVAKTPHKTAVVCDNRALTYLDLDHLSNNLAAQLAIELGDVVALHMHRSEQILVAQLAVLKKGGIFLPIDLSVPSERIEDMLEDCNARYIIVSNQEKDFSLRNDHIRFINVDDLLLDRTCSTPVTSSVTAEMGAHIIYTSGSTGKPKGSVLTHRGLVNFVYHNLVIVPGECEYDNSISINTISFDMFMCETITPLVAGITVHIATEKQQTNQELFAQYVMDNDIQILQTTPTRYKILTADKENLGFLDGFKAMLLSGEPFTTEIYNEMRANSHAHIYNTCGPSENHIWICGCELFDDDITLGFPVRNTQIYILDKQRNVLPIGVPGELCVSGDCIGLGYLNRPELNAEKYIPHPFIPGKQLYRTGDLSLFRPDGTIEPLGRMDTQVKIRGLRVELGEIESNICAFSSITNAAVVVIKRDGKDFLCAFYQASALVDEDELKEKLGQVMPNYMVPNLFIELDAFPMTSSGKIARGILAKYDISSMTVAEEHKAPATELESLICSEFERLLKIEQVSSNLDFFAAGGNSIHVIELLAHLPEEYHLSAKDVYDHPTAEKLAAFIDGHREKKYKTLSQFTYGSHQRAVVCFPFAGSDDSTFIDLAAEIKHVDPDISVYALKHANWDELCFEEVVSEVTSIVEITDSVLFYSHCAGSAMTLKVYQALADQDKIKHIVMGANVPPTAVKWYGKHLNPWMFTRDTKLLSILSKAGMDTTGLSDTARNKLISQFRVDTKCYFKEMAALAHGISASCTLVVSDADIFTPNVKKVPKLWQPYFIQKLNMEVIHGANHYFHKYRANEVASILINKFGKECP